VKELKDVLGMVADGLKSFAEGMGTIAGKMDALAKSLSDGETKPQAPKQKAAKARPKKVEKMTAKKPVTRAASKRPPQKAALKVASKNKEALTASDTVLEIISGAGDGIGPGAIMEKSGFDKKKVSNILHRLKQQGKIKNTTRGLYSKKG
jgi:hypothetical protein